MLAFEFESLVSFFVYLHYAENLYTSAEKVCLHEVGCFENSFPWITYPTEKWPLVRMRSMPLEPGQINAKLLACNGTEWIHVQNLTTFQNWYDYKKVCIYLFCKSNKKILENNCRDTWMESNGKQIPSYRIFAGLLQRAARR